MSADDLLRAAKNEEPRLLDEIMKTDLYRRLEAVRTVLALYSATVETMPATAEIVRGTAETMPATNTQISGSAISPQANGQVPERNSKASTVLKAVEARPA